MTITTAIQKPPEEELAWHPELMRSEPADTDRLAALIDEVATRGGRLRLTRPDGRDVVVLTFDELDTIEETLFWCGEDIKRVRAGEPLDDDPDEPGLDEAGARALRADLLRRLDSAQG